MCDYDVVNRLKVMIHKEMYDLLNIMPKYISPEAVATIAGILAHVNLCGEGKLEKNLVLRKMVK